MEHLLQHDTLQVVVLIAECGPYALQDKLRGAVERNGQTVALHQCSRDDTRKRVARARIVCRQIGAGYLPVTVAKAVVGIDRRRTRVAAHRYARGNDDGRAPVRKRL